MAEKAPQHVDAAPDPEEDDLDDLDDVIDEFQATKIAPPKAASSATAAPPAASGPGRPAAATQPAAAEQDALPSEEEFAKDLQASMSTLISELDANPDMQKEFEKMMQELIAAGVAPPGIAEAEPKAEPSSGKPSTAAPAPAPASASKKAAGGNTEDKFQDTIRKTMERMQASGDAATAASTSNKAKGEEALLEQMMASLLDGGAGGAGGDGDFNSMLMSMMSQLTHKDILYEPMKELHDKFPAWMEKNRAATPAADLARYEKQQGLVGEIVARFEKSGYSDDNEADRDYIVERMQDMQSAGSPPEDLVGDMAAAQEALGDLDAGCPTQ